MSFEQFKIECENMVGKNLERIEELEKWREDFNRTLLPGSKRVGKEIADLKENSMSKDACAGFNTSFTEQIDELKEDNEHLKKTIFDWLLYSSNNRKVLQEYFEYRKIWSEEIMKRMDIGYPINTWSMISLHKISKELLEKLESPEENPNNKNCIHNDICTTYLVVQNQCKECLSFKPKKDAKIEYIASLNDPKAFEAVNLGTLKRTRIKGSEGEKDVNDPIFQKLKRSN